MKLSLARKRRNADPDEEATIQGNDQTNIPTKRLHRSEDASELKRKRRSSLSQHQLNSSGVEDTKRCGKLLGMRLINFMCHSNLSIEFNSRVNFLVGSNGSGKSAVLAALVLGLGGSARNTSRSRSAKAFIRNGESTSKIEITLANDGPQPYEPDVYGSKITVLRTITASSNTYALKSENGQVISRKLDDLHRLLMFHNIQVDNPVFVLNQDSAREFLKDLEPKKNYALFMKATQIEIVNEKLMECVHLHKSHQLELDVMKNKLKMQIEEIKQHKKKLSDVEAFERLGQSLQERQTELAWLEVRQCEDKLQASEQEIEKCQKKYSDLQDMIKNKDKAIAKINEEIKSYELKISDRNKAYNEQNTLCRQTRNQSDQLQIVLQQSLAAEEMLKKKKSKLENEIVVIKQHIQERSQGNQEEVDAQRAQHQQQIAEYKQKCENDLLPKIQELREQQKQQRERKVECEKVISNIERLKRESIDKIRLMNGQIATVKASVSNKIMLYGDQMPQLLNDIKKANEQGQFSKMPRGPLGSYVEVQNSKYRDAVEKVLGQRLLRAFLVNNSKDSLVLEKILAKYNQNPTIISTTFTEEVYDVSAGAVTAPPGTKLLMQEIKCSDPVVMNCLIDHAKIETILLTNSKEVGENITSVKENVPSNLNKVVVLKEGNLALEYHPVPRYCMYSSKVRPASLLQINVEERIRDLEDEKKQCEDKCREYQSDLEHMRKDLQEATARIEETRHQLDEQEKKKREVMEKINDLENIEYADFSNELELLNKEMQEYESRLALLDQKLIDERAKITDSQNSQDQLKQKLNDCNAQLETMRGEIEEYETKIEELRRKIRSINKNENSNQNALKDTEQALQTLRQANAELTQALKDYRQSALEKGDCVETELSLDELKDVIGKIKAKLKQGRPEEVDSRSLREIIAAKEEAVETSKESLANMGHSIQSLRRVLKYRLDFLKKLKEHMSLIVQITFSMILKLRNFEGSLSVDHKEQTLTISIVPRDHNKQAVSSTKSLSGGERSYSTVALLLALWSCVDHPFYFLDEYDVFTDEVNREYMTRLLIDEGRKRPLRQYAFLTPLDMSLASEDHIKIHRFTEPIRR